MLEEIGLGERIIPDLRRLARGRIYFGHQSVGDDILRGLQRLAGSNGVEDIPLVEILPDAGAVRLPACFFAHSRIGANQDPSSKIAAFARFLREELPQDLDVAFMKFCYVDVDPESDVSNLFDEYCSTLDQLERERPSVCFLHVTIPLMARNLRIKNRIKLLLGRSTWHDDANVRRHEFNELLRRRFEPTRIIDIARVESTRPGGTREEFRRGDASFPALSRAYTSDGGHLNEAGGLIAAEELTRVVARALP